MGNLLVQIGRIAGFAGIVLCIVAVVWRVLGNYGLMGFSVGALLQAGMAGVLVACFCLLLVQAERR
ncbi:MAG: hypothetical protein WBO04_01200 [Steroidobacteraceae bacterium]